MNKVKALREALGMNMQELSKFLGIPYMTVVNWEVKNRVPSTKYLSVFPEKIQNFNKDYFLVPEERNWFKPATNYGNDKQTSPRGSNAEIRVFGKVSAGTPIATWGTGDYSMIITGHPKIDSVKKQIYGFTVNGDSFNEEFSSGDLVYASLIDYPNQKPKDRDWVITFFDTEPDTVKVNVKEFQWLDMDKKTFLLKPRSKDRSFETTQHSFKGVRMILKVHYGVKFADTKN